MNSDTQDAARYRYIKSHAGFNLNNDSGIENFEVSMKTAKGEAWYYYDDKLDAVVDAVILKNQPLTK